jgi:hypothetical protein
MGYPFVQGISYGPRKGPVKAFVIHMAEGAGTVGYLRDDATPPKRGVSVHYVVELSGRIVQMLKESDASGSINPNDLRTTEGPAPYGAKVRKRVMGLWDHDPNSAVISVEVEGFAHDGPNSNQDAALVKLVNDVRSRYPTMGLLGHRDFQDYKACPGTRILWGAIGGHGPYEGQPMKVSNVVPSLISAAKGTTWRTCSGAITDTAGLHGPITDSYSPFEGVINGSHFRAFYLGGSADGVPVLGFIHNPDLTSKPVPPAGCPDAFAELDAATASIDAARTKLGG